MKNKQTKWIILSIFTLAVFVILISHRIDFFSSFESEISREFVHGSLTILEVILWVILIFVLASEIRIKDKLDLTDTLTGGCNRTGFIKDAEKLLEKENISHYVIVYLNVCEFKSINLQIGENDADQLLCQIFQILKKQLKNNELIGRSSMDRFLLLLNEESNEDLANYMKDLIFQVKDKIKNVDVNFFVGACRVNDINSLSDTMNNASYMMSKKGDLNAIQMFDEKDSKEIQEREELLSLFDESIQNKYFQVYLQPQVPTQSNLNLQAEALVRWIHPKKGMVYPNQFIPLFEKNNRIGELDLYMFEMVCQIIEKWIHEGKSITKISVNISRMFLKYEGINICEKYMQIKDKYNVPNGVIKLELTESAMFEFTDICVAKEIISRFHACGIELALDDFGFAYSSLALLSEFDIDVLKLDRMFFVNEKEKATKIVANIINLAHELGMSVVSEGIETQRQVDMLLEMGCDYIQGYVHSKPMSLESFEMWRDEYENKY